ncbi:hypothetical protein QJS66_08005 [Kocuria rhizophila]|nr:hypothetical protein QJS66_08005 [Kocuria rhizophila]
MGPFAYLRPGTVLGEDGKIGAFVETKKSTIGRGSKIRASPTWIAPSVRTPASAPPPCS